MHDILIIGEGGRESALGLKFKQSPQVGTVYVAPGNPGMRRLGLETVPLGIDDFPRLIQFAQAHGVALTFVGPEVPLAAGIVDAFQAAGQVIFGPTQAAAQLEASKAFAKAFMHRHGLPTANSRTVHSLAAGQQVLADSGVPLVFKADGLAAGKGVVVALTHTDAEAALAHLYAADSQAPVVIEEYLQGQEASVLALYHNGTYVTLPLAQDHKRRFDNDAGPNTGGMGAISPAPQFSADEKEAARTLVARTISGMVSDGLGGCGVLYIGLMFTAAGPKILEYNLRFGDPETQVLMPQIQNDFYAVITDLLKDHPAPLQLDGQTYVAVVAAHPAYPAGPMSALPLAEIPAAWPTGRWLPAGVSEENGQLYSHGGRVFAVIGQGADLPMAQADAYRLMAAVQGPLAIRHDIGAKAVVTR
ncbi:phosphoribosylamine--glycine ligase [Schleiferilactobacillus shenzhenensis]|uniref:phosphoribosylamine--glycine ligase n=1 Tax=Schleiferilactobacillus shenzhenensis TaxID=1231337 RepID=UPI0004022B2D|nr:phosphoribosylamine--glycine ligase [Schleiferilactobacillus shenzhenensis]